MTTRRRRLVRVPASSANLGPGFDAFAAALALHVEVEVIESGRFGVETKLDIARDRRNLCVRGFARLHPPDRFTFRIRSDVPLSGGLAWSPDGTQIAFSARRGTGVSHYVVAVQEGAAPRLLFATPSPSSTPLAWSPDGTRLAVGGG